MRNLALGFAAGVTVGAGGALLLHASRAAAPGGASSSSSTAVAPAPAPLGGWLQRPSDVHPALKYGAPLTDVLRSYTGYVAAFDLRTRNPKWVLQLLTPEGLRGDGDRRGSEFFEDPALEERFRARLADYRGSGYDRGHMAPAADHKGSQAAMDETFALVNVSPQARAALLPASIGLGGAAVRGAGAGACAGQMRQARTRTVLLFPFLP
jgi:endonuclease G